jgi:hypothetical protein
MTTLAYLAGIVTGLGAAAAVVAWWLRGGGR